MLSYLDKQVERERETSTQFVEYLKAIEGPNAQKEN